MSKITINRALLEQALEALEWLTAAEPGDEPPINAAIAALRAALAQEQAEPKPMHPELRKMWEEYFDRCFRAMPLPVQEQAEPVCDKDPQGCWNVRCQLGKVCKNTTPPQRPPLTDEEIDHLWRDIARAIERKVRGEE